MGDAGGMGRINKKLLKQIYFGAAATSMGLSSVGMLTGAGMSIKYLLLVLLCLVHFEFYRQLRGFLARLGSESD